MKYLIALLTLSLLAACGGGGGNPGLSTGSPQPVLKPILTVQLVDGNNAVVSNAHVTTNGNYYVSATLKNPDGTAVGGQLISFTVSPALASLTSATARTDNSTGEARVQIFPAVGATGGAASVLATAVIDATTTVNGTLVIDVASAGVPISPQLVVKLFNADNVEVSNVTFGGGNYVKASFKDASGAPIGSRALTFDLNGSTIATLSSPTALTSPSGEAQVSIAPASVATVGAATITVTGLDGGTTYSASADFGVSPAAITLGALTLGSQTLISGGNTSVTIAATSSGVAAAGVNVALTADCGTINPVVTTDGSGIASATYSAVRTGGSSCSGLVTLTASASGATGVQRGTLNVAAPVANAINFVSATPTQIFVKASGAAEQSVVLFKVLDSNGVAMPNIPVVFSLTMNPGGVGLGASGALGNVTSNSDALGMASISVFSGTIPGPVEVKAALASNPAVFTTSKNLTVASGPPSQNHLSLSVSTFNIEGWNMDGSSTNLTVRVADRQGNPVPDGTVINFTAEGGQVAPSCATTRDAVGHAICSVAFISQNPRPVDGRATVLAYAEGLKEFVDVNGNNAFDSGVDFLADIGDAYRDDNENGQYDAGEFVIPKGGATVCAGAGGASPARANTCTGPAIQAATVRQEAVLLFASSFASFTVVRDAGAGASSFVSVRVNSADHALLPMPAGTTISATTSADGCTIGAITPSVVPNISAGTPGSQRGSVHSIELSCSKGGTIFITATTPGAGVSTFSYDVPATPIVCTPPQYLQNGVCVSPPPADTTPPTFTSVPAIDIVSTPTPHARLTVMINEAGRGYYVLLACTGSGSSAVCPAAPSPAALRLSGTQVTLSGGVPFQVDLVTSPGTVYRLYFLAVDSVGNMQASVTEALYPSTTSGPGFPGP